MVEAIYTGQRVLLECRFYLLGVPTDPDIVRCLVRGPSKALVTFTFPDEALTRREEGFYEAAVVVDQGGTWACRWEGAGTVDAVNEISFQVASSIVAAITTGG